MKGIDPNGQIKQYDSVENRFWDKVDIGESDQCWEWKASTVHGRYGKFKTGGKTYAAHRFAWIITFGDIPDGAKVLHKCNYSMCVNPNHLALGSQVANMRDKKYAMIDRFSKEVVIQSILDVIQKDPHQWDRDSCISCKVICKITNTLFGCYAPPPRGQ